MRVAEALAAHSDVTEAYLSRGTFGDHTSLVLGVLTTPALSEPGRAALAHDLHGWLRPVVGDDEIDFLVAGTSEPLARQIRAGGARMYLFLAVVGSQGVRRLGQVDREVVYGYLAALRGKGYQPETIHRRLASLQSSFRYLMTERAWGPTRHCVYASHAARTQSRGRTSGTPLSRCSTRFRPGRPSGCAIGAC